MRNWKHEKLNNGNMETLENEKNGKAKNGKMEKWKTIWYSRESLFVNGGFENCKNCYARHARKKKP